MCQFVVQADPATGASGTVTQPRRDVMAVVAVVLFLHFFRIVRREGEGRGGGSEGGVPVSMKGNSEKWTLLVGGFNEIEVGVAGRLCDASWSAMTPHHGERGARETVTGLLHNCCIVIKENCGGKGRQRDRDSDREIIIAVDSQTERFRPRDYHLMRRVRGGLGGGRSATFTARTGRAGGWGCGISTGCRSAWPRCSSTGGA